MTSLLGGHTVEFRADGSGTVTRRYWVGIVRASVRAGRTQVAGVGAAAIHPAVGNRRSARVARILKQKGPAGVLAEISLIEGSWCEAAVLLRAAEGHDARRRRRSRQLLGQAGREIDSDFELATLLIDNADRLLVDDAARQAYFDASQIDRFGLRDASRVFGRAQARTTSRPALLVSMLSTSRNIDSDFEEASLLVDVAKLQPLDNTTRPAFFSALEYRAERLRTSPGAELRWPRAAILPRKPYVGDVDLRRDVSAPTSRRPRFSSLVKQQPIEGNLRAPFFHGRRFD